MPKRKHASQSKLTSWLRSSRSRSSGRRHHVARRSIRRVPRNRKRARGRVSSYRKRGKGSSTFSKLTRVLAPVNSYSFQVAGRATVVTGAATGISGVSPCKWFTPNRAVEVSLAYPNWLDVSAQARALNEMTQAQNQTAVLYGLESLNLKFITRNYVQSTKMVNQSNAQAVVYYHVLEARRDIPHWTGTGLPPSYNILNLLGLGFYQTALASSGVTGVNVDLPVATTNVYDTNTALVDSAFNIYQSGPFLHYFKVKKVQRVIMNAGDIKVFSISHSSPITNCPALYNNLVASTGTWAYGSNNPQFAFLKGAQFQLFKLHGTPFNSAALPTLVNTTQPAVDFITTCHSKYQAVVRAGGIQYRASNYNLGAFTDGQFMGEQQELPLAALNA